MSAATATSVEASSGTATRRQAKDKDLTEVEARNATTADKVKTSPQLKYRHVAAVHSQTRPSCLSHDSPAAPSFIGFRNLMVIVLGTCWVFAECVGAASLTLASGRQPAVDD